jgi:hypothetical protein
MCSESKLSIHYSTEADVYYGGEISPESVRPMDGTGKETLDVSIPKESLYST